MSSVVYSGLTRMPSGVCQFNASTSPPGADLAADLRQASRLVGLKGDRDAGEEEGAVLSELMTKSDSLGDCLQGAEPILPEGKGSACKPREVSLHDS